MASWQFSLYFSIGPIGREPIWEPAVRFAESGAVFYIQKRQRGGPRRSSRLAVLLLCYRHSMAVRKKRSISMPPDLDAEIAAAAADAGLSYSSWLADTARKEFTIRAGLAAVSQFEQDHGPFTAEELADADEWAGRAIQRSGAGAGRRSA
jgi:hypothetical protein